MCYSPSTQGSYVPGSTFSTLYSLLFAFVDVYSQQPCHFSLKIDLSLLLKRRYVFNVRIYLVSRSFSITTFKKWDILNVCCFPAVKADGYQANLVTLASFPLHWCLEGYWYPCELQQSWAWQNLKVYWKTNTWKKKFWKSTHFCGSYLLTSTGHAAKVGSMVRRWQIIIFFLSFPIYC